MSIFAKVTGEIKAAELERVQSEAMRVRTQQQARDKFKIDFLNAWTSIAKPAFDEFVTDAQAHGYDAKVIEHGLNTSKYGATLFLMPIIGKALLSNAQAYLRLSGEPFDQSVEVVTSFDQVKNPKYFLESLSRDLLEIKLTVFLRLALKSVPPAEPSQPPTLVVSLKDFPHFDVTSTPRINEA